ncbi:hypothetical protein WR25_11314 [Diploscapter pachys]|uniref:C2H2-type domain-containing protein n=1 Tax=Diploscapter pachys TaxID=2018661 RepID=A0A2A2JIS7_9BILA|nr:hypothetical protein WR25_11314 [Diploscapter pachys]
MTPTAIRKSERISQCGAKPPKRELYSEQLYAMHTEVVTSKKPPSSKTMVFTHSSSTPFMVKEKPPSPPPLPSPSVPNRETQAASPTCSVTVQPIKIVPLNLPDILSPNGSNGKNVEVKQEICSDDGLISEPPTQVKTESNLAKYFEKLKKEIELELYLRRYMKQKEKEEGNTGNQGTQNAEQAEQQPMELFVKKESALVLTPVVKKETSVRSSTPSPSSSQGSPWIEHKELESLLIRNVRKDPLTGKLKCPVCGKLITRTFGMKVHMRTHSKSIFQLSQVFKNILPRQLGESSQNSISMFFFIFLQKFIKLVPHIVNGRLLEAKQMT